MVKLPSRRTDILMLWPLVVSLMFARNCSASYAPRRPPLSDEAAKNLEAGRLADGLPVLGSPPFLSPFVHHRHPRAKGFAPTGARRMGVAMASWVEHIEGAEQIVGQPARLLVP